MANVLGGGIHWNQATTQLFSDFFHLFICFLFFPLLPADPIPSIHCEGIRMQNHKWNEVENAFPTFKVCRLVRVHTDSHHNGHNKMIFAVSDV